VLNFDSRVSAASRALVLGIGGGGDVVGSIGVGRRCEALGTEFVLGGVAWERLPIDPVPGPRPAEQIHGGRRAGARAVIADAQTSTPEGVLFSESHVAAHLGAETVLIDITAGAVGAAEGVTAAAAELECDLVVYADVGGDAIATGAEPGLGSPLCDAVMLAAAMRLRGELDGVIAMIGAGCDGELTIEEVLDRIAALAKAGAWIDTFQIEPAAAEEILRAAEPTGTEASVQLARSALGARGEVEIRGGRRRLMLSPLSALGFCFDLDAALGELPLVRAVLDTEMLEHGRDALNAMGVGTELDYEQLNA
jgi:hypothetical protein